MARKYKLPALCRYKELSSSEQITVHEMLISLVRKDYRYNIIMVGYAKPYNLVKLISINFEKEDSGIWVRFETITGENRVLPLDLISKIEISGQKEI